MGIFSRIRDLFRANVNNGLDNVEEPEIMLKQMVLDMEESISNVTDSVAKAMANEKNLEKKIEKAKAEQLGWEEKATIALKSNREDLAVAAIEKKAIAIKNVADLEPMYIQAKDTSIKLKGQLEVLRNKLEEARGRESTLIARSQAAKIQRDINKSIGGIGTDSFSKFDKYESKIESLESEALALGELNGNSSDLNLEFKKLVTANIVEDELTRLKRNMGLIPPAENVKLLNG